MPKKSDGFKMNMKHEFYGTNKCPSVPERFEQHPIDFVLAFVVEALNCLDRMLR
jgi:hypothetical protein